MARMVNLVMTMFSPPNNDDDNDDRIGDDNKDNEGDAKDDKADDGGLVEPVNLSFENVSDFTTEGMPREVGTTMRTSITAALFSEASRGGKKRSSASKGGEGGEQRRARH